MNLATNASRRTSQFCTGSGFVHPEPGTEFSCDHGYAMAALLVAMSVMAIVMTVALPTWSHMIRREKEEELIFRGNQYARAIGQYQRKYASASPPSLDVLIEQRFLRKKFKDPLSPEENGEFGLLYVGGQQTATGTARQGGAGGAIMGVFSTNTGESIRTYNGKSRYNEWQFVALQQSTQAGGGAQQQGAAAGAKTGTGQGGPTQQSQPPR